MNTYIVNIKTPNGYFVNVEVKAGTQNQAGEVAKNMYGPGTSVLAITQIGGW